MLKFLMFGNAFYMGYCYFATLEEWYLVAQWVCLIAGITMFIDEVIDDIKQRRRDHEKHVEFMKQHEEFMSKHRRN